MARQELDGLVNYRGYDWSTFQPPQRLGSRETDKVRRAIVALEDPAVADATYRLANFGDAASANSWLRAGPLTWLMVAYTAAVALDRL